MSSIASTNNDWKRALVTERRGATFVVTINRPEVRNAINGPTAGALAQALRAFDSDAALAVAVLTGSGGTFCSGFDLKAVADGTRARQVSEEGGGLLGITGMPLSKPAIAAVEGHAVAGGLEVALWCDLRVAADNAIFGVFNRRWGMPLVDGGTIRLPRLIGQSHALDLILTGRGVSGQEALTMASKCCVPERPSREHVVSLPGMADMAVRATSRAGFPVGGVGPVDLHPMLPAQGGCWGVVPQQLILPHMWADLEKSASDRAHPQASLHLI